MINCIVVDDEPLARSLMENYIGQVPELHRVASCQTAVEAFTVIHAQPVDLMFLDIQMPDITGMNFFKSLRNPPKVIFTTAYAEYAIDAFEMEAVDYLLKPIVFERFLKAVQKVNASQKDQLAITAATIVNPYIFLKIDRKLVKINHADIIYIEGFGDYLKIHTTEKTQITYSTLNKLELLLPPEKFIRIHRSTIVNKDFIQFVEGNYAKVEKHDLPIGQTYRDELLKRL